MNKRGGLRGDRDMRRALLMHVLVYTLVFVPAVIWIASQKSALALLLLPLISIPHLVQDDGTVLQAWNRIVKHSSPVPGDPVYMAIDQAFHVVFLFGTALLVLT